MLVASVGATLRRNWNDCAFADVQRPAFVRQLEPLVDLLQDTPVEKIAAAVVGKSGPEPSFASL